MHTFTDARERRWTVDLSVGVAKRIRDATGVDITDPDIAGLMDKLNDTITLCDVLWVCVQDEADTHTPPVTDEEFGMALAGDAIDAATSAFLEELVDFSPSRRRAILRPMLDRLRAEEAKAAAAIDEMLPAVLDQVFSTAEVGEKSTGSPES